MPQTIASPGEEVLSVTTAEAAWLTDMPPKAINAAIDRGELPMPSRKRGSDRAARRLGPAEVVYLVLRRDLSSVLSQTAKRELYDQLVELSSRRYLVSFAGAGPQPDFEIALAGGVVRIEAKRACQQLAKRWEALRRAQELVVSDPEIRGGEPIIKGTRIPVYMIAALVDQGADVREILEDYPALNAAKIRSALAFARTQPRRGRPRKAPLQL